jgi:hypothetical protein
VPVDYKPVDIVAVLVPRFLELNNAPASPAEQAAVVDQRDRSSRAEFRKTRQD